MNLKSAAMATGLVLTFAAGAWLSTIMLAPPQRPNRVAVQEQRAGPKPRARSFRRRGMPERLAGYAGIRFHPAAASAIAPDTRRDAPGASTCRRSRLRLSLRRNQAAQPRSTPSRTG